MPIILIHVFGTRAAMEQWLYGQTNLSPSVKVIKNQSMMMIEMEEGAVRLYLMLISGREDMYRKLQGIQPHAVFEHDSFNDERRRADRIPHGEWTTFLRAILRR